MVGANLKILVELKIVLEEVYNNQEVIFLFY